MKLFNNLKIKEKLLISFIILSVIGSICPLILYFIAKENVENKTIEAYKSLNQQMIQAVDNYLYNLAKITEIPMRDLEIQKILTKNYNDYEYPQYEKLEDNNKITHNFFTSLFLLNTNIDSIIIYPNNSDVVYRRGYNIVFEFDYSPKNEEWYKKIIKAKGKKVIVGIHKDKQTSKNKDKVITVGRSIIKALKGDFLGTILLNVNAYKIGDLFRNINFIKGSSQLIIDENNNIVYSNNKEQIGQLASNKLMNYIKKENVIKRGSLNNERVIIINYQSKYSNWRAVNIISQKILLKEIESIRTIMFVLAFIFLLILIGLSVIISKNISQPLEKLTNAMKEVSRGNLDIKIDMNTDDEVIILNNVFNNMLRKIKLLLIQTKEESEQKHNAEIQALQAQINPHFMYNTLNIIKRMSQMQGADNITETLDSLIYMLNFTAKTVDEIIQVKDEIDFVKNYLEILEIRYFNKFYTEYFIDEKVYNYKTLKFILQPFIENAVFHGFIDQDKYYVLKIFAEVKEQAIVFTIIDNGVGINENTLEKIMHENVHNFKGFNSIGAANVINRIKLYFGENYGVDIKSQEGTGTKVIIQIPKNRIKN